MIYDGIRGYISGDMNQAADTVLIITKGPIKGRNWNYAGTDPSYGIVITAAATGTVILEGTNDVAIRDDTGGELNPIEKDLLPTEGASWDTIHAATGVSVTGTFSTEYQFLRLRIATQGSAGDYVTRAFVRWA